MNESIPDHSGDNFPYEQRVPGAVTLVTEASAPLPVLGGQPVTATSADDKLTFVKVLRDLGIVVLVYVVWIIGIGVFVILLKNTLSRSQFGIGFAVGVMVLQTIAYGIIGALGRQSAGARTVRLFVTTMIVGVLIGAFALGRSVNAGAGIFLMNFCFAVVGLALSFLFARPRKKMNAAT